MTTSSKIKYAARGCFLGLLVFFVLFYGEKSTANSVPLIGNSVWFLFFGLPAIIVWTLAGYFIGSKTQCAKESKHLSAYGAVFSSLYALFYIYFILVELQGYSDSFMRSNAWFFFSLPASVLFKWLGYISKITAVVSLLLILPLNVMLFYWIIEKMEMILRYGTLKHENVGAQLDNKIGIVNETLRKSKLWLLLLKCLFALVTLIVCFKFFFILFKPINFSQDRNKIKGMYALPSLQDKRKILCHSGDSTSYYFVLDGLVWYHYDTVGWSASAKGDIKLENSNFASFECIDRNYAKDKNNVYYVGVKVEKADPLTFEPLDWPNARDKNYYFEGYKIKR